MTRAPSLLHDPSVWLNPENGLPTGSKQGRVRLRARPDVQMPTRQPQHLATVDCKPGTPDIQMISRTKRAVLSVILDPRLNTSLQGEHQILRIRRLLDRQSVTSPLLPNALGSRSDVRPRLLPKIDPHSFSLFRNQPQPAPIFGPQSRLILLCDSKAVATLLRMLAAVTINGKSTDFSARIQPERPASPVPSCATNLSALSRPSYLYPALELTNQSVVTNTACLTDERDLWVGPRFKSSCFYAADSRNIRHTIRSHAHWSITHRYDDKRQVPGSRHDPVRFAFLTPGCYRDCIVAINGLDWGCALSLGNLDHFDR